MDLERERGITIKAHAVRLNYKADDGETYVLNLIDTPGHVDFSYEVSRSLAACEGALLVVDASQGVEAQTLANTYLALENNLEIIPVINKIDLPGAEPEKRSARSRTSSASTRATRSWPAPRTASASTSSRSDRPAMPPPKGDPSAAEGADLRLLVRHLPRRDRPVARDRRRRPRRHEDPLHGQRGRSIRSSRSGRSRPSRMPVDELGAGEVGFVFADIKTVSDAQIGDTITEAAQPDARAVPRLQGNEADGLRRALSRSKAANIRSCATRWRSCG